MPSAPNADLTSDHINGWWVGTAQAAEVGPALASSPLAILAFFLGWIAIGVGVARPMVRRGHDRKIMTALGIGLGPLMIVVAVEAVTRREREARPLLLASGFDQGGDLDVLVLVPGDPDQIRSLVPTLTVVKSELGTLTLARAVPYEWVDDHSDNEVIVQASSALVAAREFVPITGPALAVFPGTPRGVAQRFSARWRRTLVLFATDEPATSNYC